MKPLRLEIQAFGPYVDRQTVRFDQLAQKGMFLIKGPTGSGKTTIFDAMTFALYGGSSGDNSKSKFGRNDLEGWRCNQAPKDAITEVSFTFSVRERTYQFTRRLKPTGKSLSEKYSAGEIDENGTLIPFFENPTKSALNQKAQALIGLTKEQFRQVVLLPQGQFERFLVASSDEKEEILTTIFDTSQWKCYAENFYNSAADRKRELDEEKSTVVLSLKEEGFAAISELAEHIEDLRQEKQLADAAHTEFGGRKKQEQLNADIQLAEQLKPLRQLRNRQAQLLARKPEMEQLAARYEKAERAETLRRVIADQEQAQREYVRRKSIHAGLLAGLPEAEAAWVDAQARKKDHDAHSPVEELLSKIGAYEQKRPFYEKQQGLADAFARAELACRSQEKKAKSAQEALERATKTAADRLAACDAAERTAKEYRNRYYAGIYGEIAAQLLEGEHCPVCGSTSHPFPARKAAGSVSKAEAERMEAAAEAAKTVWKTSDGTRIQAEEIRNRERELLNESTRKKAEAQAALEGTRANLIPGIEDGKALENRLRTLHGELEGYNVRTQQLQTALENAQNRRNQLRTQIETSERELQNAAENHRIAGEFLNRALAEAGYGDVPAAKADQLSTEERNVLHRNLVAYEQDCRNTEAALAEKERELAGLEEPDITLFAVRQKAITDEAAAYTRRSSELGTTIERLTAKQIKLQKKWEHYESHFPEAENDLAFARKLRGDTGIGLQRYVLAILFNQVIGEANRMLEKVHEGRYRLYRSDDRGAGNKRGLELKVHDNRSPDREGRSVSMLSGGEKFLVSLALSIGMSTVAQSSGIKIEALFIDEGFGTLDDYSIHDAMDILESVRRTSGMIGIISHVSLLESNITTHLEVVKSPSGSTIVMG